MYKLQAGISTLIEELQEALRLNEIYDRRLNDLALEEANFLQEKSRLNKGRGQRRSRKEPAKKVGNRYERPHDGVFNGDRKADRHIVQKEEQMTSKQPYTFQDDKIECAEKKSEVNKVSRGKPPNQPITRKERLVPQKLRMLKLKASCDKLSAHDQIYRLEGEQTFPVFLSS
ncbi:hypothetical protein KIN20_013427 [Parelaphostrongylus tenuis]|uniref:Uncharacterized protein n=1 Tax=Parelaphostrongylus tenuis TaxID=148309 RepID=A0AAD5MY35_PARTN|nr:hypothetical protein KIN20_013427 [Parelaphostrongylus tenuis]